MFENFAEIKSAPLFDGIAETELPELHTVPTPEAALDLSPETVARAAHSKREAEGMRGAK